jgi:hypothetical protein
LRRDDSEKATAKVGLPFLLLGPFEVKYSLVFADEHPSAAAQDFQKQFLGMLRVRGSVGGGNANFIFPGRSLRSRAANVPNPWRADRCVGHRRYFYFVMFDAEAAPEVTMICIILCCGPPSKVRLDIVRKSVALFGIHLLSVCIVMVVRKNIGTGTNRVAAHASANRMPIGNRSEFAAGGSPFAQELLG